ncbi:MAG: hypothetical protein SFZ03_07710 [Candidatus Melainabacteria bacterium]|nr:hypothetical protein [Candidatus Melainabacteria bacterium]
MSKALPSFSLNSLNADPRCGVSFASLPSVKVLSRAAESYWVPGVQFGRIVHSDRKRLPDADYAVLKAMPGYGLHIHQSGSSNVAFLWFRMLQDIQSGRIQEMLDLKPDAPGRPQSRSSGFDKIFTKDYLNPQVMDDIRHGRIDRLEKLPPEAFNWDTLQEYYRVDLSAERKTVPIGETGIPLVSDAREQALRDNCFSTYRYASSKINPLVKNVPAAYMCAFLHGMDEASDNVRYSEYRVEAVTRKDLGAIGRYECDMDELFFWVDKGLEHAQARLLQKDRQKFDYGLIALINRAAEPEEALQQVQQIIALRAAGKYNLVGIDFAGDELNHAIDKFPAVFEAIHNYNRQAPESRRLGVTIHAGETRQSKNPITGEVYTGAQSIAKAVALAWSPETPVRIGHGLQLVYSSPLLEEAFAAYLKDPVDWQKKFPHSQADIVNSSPILKELIDKDIVVEVCPKSNVQTYGVHHYQYHSAVFLSRLGVPISINSDNKTISKSDLPNDRAKLYIHRGATYDDLKKMVFDSIRGAFIFGTDPETGLSRKESMRRETQQAFQALERTPSHVLGIYRLRHHGQNPNPLHFVAMTLWAHAQTIWHDFTRFYFGKDGAFRKILEQPESPCHQPA